MKKAVVVILALCLTLACGSSRKVYRIEPETQTDLSGKWNDTDARLVAEEMVSDCLSRVWLTNWVADAGEKPIVTVGTIRNRSSEHIDMETFTTDFERELINSGHVRFVASKDQREEIREDERMDQQEWASLETVKRIIKAAIANNEPTGWYGRAVTEEAEDEGQETEDPGEKG